MILLQLSSAQGPDECCLAVKKALDCLTKEAAREKVSLTRLETEPGRLPDTLRSALVSLDGEKLWLSVNVGVARYCGFVPARIVRTMGEKLVRRHWALFRRRAHTV
ncbi:peptide chain release factor [Salmonella enterica subsp. enterica]|uniref:Peptide chain release factor n=1 Tax=Salmonella enterica I TaxID=59201 RepID=A0A379WZU7_SALET|nr:peptide chain release factor [Salmonella enterica subsp. enterica]